MNILIADRSECGWPTVAEYEDEELADNSDDEKCLFRAEVRAGRKLKQKSAREQKKKGGASKKPFRSSWSSPAPWSGEHAQSSSAAAAFTPGMQLFVPQLFNQGPAMVRHTPTAPAGASQLGSYFLCGRMGHYRKACPLLQNVAASKST